MTKRRNSRRSFLKSTATFAGVGFWTFGIQAQDKKNDASANNKLNIAIIGAGGQGGGNLNNVAGLGENIVALCDVDDGNAAKSYDRFPHAKRFHDYRKMFDDLHKQIDAVVVSTPDHHHAPASVMAMNLGKHVYCEKPLTHSVYEARIMGRVARLQKVATQMGNHGHALEGTRRAVEVVQAGAIGKVREAHVWTDRPIWPQDIDRPANTPSVPNHMDWYLWLGPAPDRPYNPAYAPFRWRGWWDFGTGALGDMACHVMDMAFWALGLTAPVSVSAESPTVHPETAPKWSIITYEFPARGDDPPVKVVWYDGKKKPPKELGDGQELPDNGTILVGDKGRIYSPDAYGSRIKLLPEKDFEGFKGPEPSIPRSPGHHREWVIACKGGPASLSNFEYASKLTETVLLGNVALRVGKKIRWDSVNLKAIDCSDADPFVRREYRKGWTL